MKHRLLNMLLAPTLFAAALSASAQSFGEVANATLDAIRENREQAAAETDVRSIFAKAKKAADEDDKLNLCGFYTGMSAADVRTLVGHYALKDGEWSIEGDPVYSIHLSLKGVRRVTKGGNTFDELAQAVANRVGSLKQDWETKVYGLKTIDGISVTMSESSGFTMIDTDAKYAAQRKAREERERKAREERERTAHEERERKAREERERKAREERERTARKAAVEGILASMVDIPGKDFKMGKTELTQAQWEAIMGKNPSYFKGENNPVESVSWDDCQEFLKKLNELPSVKKTGLTFRLPTEEEWEQACRAGATGDYCLLADGTEVTRYTLGEVAWFKDNSDITTHPVGQKQPNAWGLYDMHGNVMEWTSTADGEDRVLRGGSWRLWDWICESSYRSEISPSVRRREFDTGFRLCASGGAD